MRTAKETATRIARKTGVTCDAVPGGAPGHAYIVGRRGAWAATSREAWRIARLEARGITAQGTYTIDATGVHACPPVVPESRDAIVAAALRDGFTHVMTASGPVPLDDWQPYGTGVPHPWRGTWTGRDTVEDVGPDGDRLGVWTFVRVADAGGTSPATRLVGPASSGEASYRNHCARAVCANGYGCQCPCADCRSRMAWEDNQSLNIAKFNATTAPNGWLALGAR